MNNKEIRIFLRRFLMFCLALTGLAVLLFLTVLQDFYLRIFPLQFGLVAFITLISHLRLMNSFQLNIRRFSTTFLSTMSIKLLIYMAFILICLVIDRSAAINFVITFLTLYVCFTIFEVIEISDFLKKNSKSSN